MAKFSNDPLSAYRVDVYGSARDDVAAALVALTNTRNDLALAYLAVNDLSVDVTDENHARILLAVGGILRDSVDTISAAEDVLEEQGDAKC